MGKQHQVSVDDRRAERAKIVGHDLAEVMPDYNGHWWTQPHLLRLNALLSICCASSATLGYDGTSPVPDPPSTWLTSQASS
jgi:hypothetical protein